MEKKLKNPDGGLTQAGRDFYKRTQGSNLKPGVKNYSEASTPDKKRWVRWALRFAGRSDVPPLKKPNGEPTRFALMFAAWGEPVPSTVEQVRSVHRKAMNRREQLKMGEDKKLSLDYMMMGGCEHCGEMDHDTSEHVDPDEIEGKDLEPRQNAMYQMYELIADQMGKWDTTTGPHGAHYAPADKNPFIEDGLICANCVFYEGGGECEIVEGPMEDEGRVEPNAVCKLWIIPEGLVAGQDETSQEEQQDAAEGEMEDDSMEMSVLTAKQRDALPDSAFVFPEKKAYPIHDLAHARAALSMVAQHGSPEEQAKVRAAVHKRYPQLAKNKE